MPNHCKNILEISGIRAAECVAALGGNDSVLDFNRVTPMPAILEETVVATKVDFGPTVPGCVDDGGSRRALDGGGLIQVRDSTREQLEKLLPLGFPGIQHIEQSLRAEAETGCRNWLEWREIHWTTKWNAFDASIDKKSETKVEFHFCTACSPPLQLVCTVSEQWPDINIALYYHEPMGGFEGELKLLAGNGRWKEFECQILDNDDDASLNQPILRIDRAVPLP